MANPLESGPVRYDDAFERLDARIFRVEAAIIGFALLAMSVTFFLKIVYEAVIAERNFVDAFLLRWLHRAETPPAPALVATVHGVYTPSLVAAVLLLTGVAAARTAVVQRAEDAGLPPPAWGGGTAAAGVGVAAGLAATGWLVTVIPAPWLCAALYAGGVVMFGVRARRMGELAAFAVVWTALSLPIGALIAIIPDQYAWVNDLAKVLIMVVGFVGASMASRERKHILLNFGRKLWPRTMQRGFEAASLGLWLAFDLLLLALAWHLFELARGSGSKLSILPLPEYWISLPVVISFALMSLRVAADLVRVVRGARPAGAAAQEAA